MAKNQERKLTDREIRRIQMLDEKTEELKQQGYNREDQIISIKFANVMAFIWSLPFIALFVVWFILQNGFNLDFSFVEYLVVLLMMFVLIVVHELIHGFTWGIFAKNHFKSIDFGIIKEYMTPYCTCLEPLSKGCYILGALMPFLVLGIGISVGAVLAGRFVWLILGIVMIMGAGGDLTIVAKMLTLRTVSKDVIIMDHPSECGFIAFVNTGDRPEFSK